MIKPGADVALLSPAAIGWRLRLAGVAREFGTMEAAAAAVPAQAQVDLALPCQAVLLERLTLPSRDRAELQGMAMLQLEKTLPYPGDEVTSGLEVVSEEGEASTVLSMAVHIPALAELCQPLRDLGHLPQRISLFAQAAVAQAAEHARALVVWPEQEHLVLAIAEEGRLGWAQTLGATDPETLATELPTFLLGAEMSGIPTAFARVLLAEECAPLGEILRLSVNCPVDLFQPTRIAEEGVPNFLPPGWSAESGRVARAERLKHRLLLAAVGYLVLLAIGFLYLAWSKRHLLVLDARIAQLQPLIQTTRARQELWEVLGPATDWRRYAVETLALVNQNRPNDEVRITTFDTAPGQFMVEGEAPSAELAIDFAERLRAEKALEAYHVEMGPPQILPNEHAQFRLFGKP